MQSETVKQRLGLLAVLMILLMSLASCEYEFIEIDEPDPDVPISFANDIIPIFTTGNNCTACHRTGSTSPDLTAANAYNSIVPGLVNLSDPESSRIYTVPLSSHVVTYTPIQAANVLNWIKQGAENN
jgi:hypothetical protein